MVYSDTNFPVSKEYQDYVSVGTSGVGVNPVGTSSVFTPSDSCSLFAASCSSAISIGVMGGYANVVVSQGGTTLLAGLIGGPLQWTVVTSSSAYCYANFISNGQNLQVTATVTYGDPLVAYNVYNNYITAYTASLITYPPQFSVNMGPTVTPTNTGISFTFVAPTLSLPTPLAIWVEETFPNSATVSGVQIGIENGAWRDSPSSWSGASDLGVSYFTGLGVFYRDGSFSGGSYCNGIPLQPGPIKLVPGNTYTIAMALASGTTWESLLNGQCIGEADLGTNTAGGTSGPATLGLETLTAEGGTVAITNEISIPVITSFQVNGQWSQASDFSFGSVGENWWNNEATSAPGIDLWGIAGNLQDTSVPLGSLLFGNSLPMVLDVPTTWQSSCGCGGEEPLYGDFSLSQTSSGGGIVTVSKVSSSSILVSPVGASAFVSVGSYITGNSYLQSLTDALITAPTQFTLPGGSSLAVVYASDSSFTSYSVSSVQLSKTSPLVISSDSPINILVTDPNGHQAGFASDGTEVNQMPGATLLGPCSSQSDVQVSVTIPNPIAGQYSTTIFPSCATQSGSAYTINIQDPTTSQTYDGIAYKGGSSQTILSSLDSGGQVSISVPPVVTKPTISTTTAVSCVPNPFAVGSNSSCTAKVSGGSTPSGMVVFTQYSGAGSVLSACSAATHIPCPGYQRQAMCTLSSGSCSLNVTGFIAGNVTIWAFYSGDSTHQSSNDFLTITVERAHAPASVVIDCTPLVLVLGSSGSCSATVGGTSPTGQVAWSEIVILCAGTQALCVGGGFVSFSSTSCTLSSGQCQIDITGTASGPVSLVASYSGDSNNKPSSGTTSITVTSVVITCTPSSVVVGTSSSCNAAIKGSSPTGTVAWSSSSPGKFSKSSCKLSKGVCSVKFTPTAAGPVVITASYGGNSRNPASSGTYSLNVEMMTSKITISCKPNPDPQASPVKCRATVTGYRPTGTVSWSLNGTMGTVHLVSNSCVLANTGKSWGCSVTLSGSTSGWVYVKAVYAGDSNNNGSSNTERLDIG